MASNCSKQREFPARLSCRTGGPVLTAFVVHRRPYLSLRPPNLPSPRLPTHFSPSDHSELLSISPSGFTVSFMPRTSRDGEQDAASVRANLPIDPTSGLFYYEVEIISAGERGYIGIGYASCVQPST